MKKILLPVNAAKLNIPVVDFAAYLAKLTHSTLSVIFMEKVYGEPKPALKWALGVPYVETVTASDIPYNEEMLKAYEQNEHLLKEACCKRGVNVTIHQDRHNSLNEIIAESRFADLVIVDAELSFHEKYEGAPTAFAKEILIKSECPVVTAPYSFEEIDEIVFAYDGSASSVFAIKQFNYLFPEFSDKKITAVQVNKTNNDTIIERNKITTLLQNHYSSIGFHQLNGNPPDALFEFLLGKKNMLVVIGAYGKHMLSRLFSDSTADLALKTINLPFFITHH